MRGPQWMNKNYFFLIIGLCLFGFVFDAHARCWDGTVVEVTDDNTLLVSRGQTRTAVTLYGIDAPASGQDYSADAMHRLNALLLNKKVTVCPQKMPGVNAVEVYVLSGYKLNVNEEMVRKGLAWSTVDQYKNLENTARTKRLGLWSADDPMPPHEYRRKASVQRSQEKQNAFRADDWNLNASSDGLNVYKAPPQAFSTADNATQVEVAKQRLRELEALREKQQQHNNDDSLSLTDIDDFKISTYFEDAGYRSDGVVEVRLDYRSTALGREVLWTDGDVNCDCSVNGHFNEGSNTRIAKTSVILSSYTDRVYIDIPYKYLRQDTFIELNSCTVECTISAGIFSLKSSDKFYVYYPGIPYFLDNSPPSWSRPGHDAPEHHYNRGSLR